jgi:hypothetical protein
MMNNASSPAENCCDLRENPRLLRMGFSVWLFIDMHKSCEANHQVEVAMAPGCLSFHGQIRHLPADLANG